MPRTLRGVAVIILLLVLFPLLIFTVYEINGLSAGESFVAGVYRGQLDVVLFSLNQFAWNVVNTWASTAENGWKPSGNRGTFSPGFTEKFLGKNPAIDAVFVADSAGAEIFSFTERPDAEIRWLGGPGSWLAGERPLIDKLLALSRQNYRKIEPCMIADSSGRKGVVVLLFVLRGLEGVPALAGIRLREERFVQDVLAERMREAAAGEFILSVVNTSTGESVYASEEGAAAEPEQRRQLWLFPDLAAGIRLKGETVQQVAQSRVRRDLVILLVLDAFLLTGVWVVFRSVRREMEFVRLKSDFVSNVSHELRTPLALIRMYAETLEMGRLTEDGKKQDYYATIVKETERLTHLVNNLLNFSRMDAGRRPYALAAVDLNAAVKGVLESFSPHLRSEGFFPEVTLDPSIPAVRADLEAVQEAIINILDNAVKYSGAQKYLRVATGARPEGPYVEIEDRGRGIPTEYHKRVFETFFRVPAGRNPGVNGSGLGLSIARHIMEAHGGRIDLQSTPGEGSTFTLVFRNEHNTGH
jgi:two-component system phosphate regulon sensor histidine kinase PhoR